MSSSGNRRRKKNLSTRKRQTTSRTRPAGTSSQGSTTTPRAPRARRRNGARRGSRMRIASFRGVRSATTPMLYVLRVRFRLLCLASSILNLTPKTAARLPTAHSSLDARTRADAGVGLVQGQGRLGWRVLCGDAHVGCGRQAGEEGGQEGRRRRCCCRCRRGQRAG